MKYEELDKLSRGEQFDKIKALCRFQAIIGLCIAVVILIATIALVKRWGGLEELRSVLICLFAVGCIASGWMVVNNLWFLYKQRSLDMPDQLLHWYEKRFKNDRKAVYLVGLGIFIGSPSLWYNIFNLDDQIWILTELAFMAVVIGLMIYSYCHDDILGKFKTRRDEEIFDRLDDLAKKI